MATQPLHPGRPLEPALIDILPGLSALPRQIGIFPAFRAALLEDASRETALTFNNWRGRDVDDFGVMLLEMFAYVSDVLSFYDSMIAGESYLRTAMRVAAARNLVALIGYLPRPASAALVDVALLLEGRLPVTIPVGTAFRSSAFEAEKPQVFTVLEEATVHPLRAKFTLTPQPKATLAGTSGTLLTQAITCKRGSVGVKAGDAALVRAGTSYAAGLVQSVEPIEDAAGNPLTSVAFGSTLELAAGTPISNTALRRPSGTAFVNASSTYYSNSSWYSNGVILDGLYKSIKTGDLVLLRYGDYVRWFKAQSVTTYNWTVSAAKTVTGTYDGKNLSTSVPAVTVPHTKITFDAEFNHNGHRAPEDTASWTFAAVADFTLYFGLTDAGVLAGKANAGIASGDVLKVREKVQLVEDGYEPDRFILSDLDETAVSVDGTLAAGGSLTVSDPDAWDGALTAPVTVYGALVRATRGERVATETLGTGDGSMPNQTFKLKKKPLTYVGAAGGIGVQSTLQITVDGVRWYEVERFYGRDATERIYTVRQNEDGDSVVMFGDGVRGARLPTGAVVVGAYYFGAGAAAPPARGVTQMVTPVKGVTSAVNPIAAFGGSDAEDEAGMKTYAPRSALMLGRAVSLPDYEAVAAGVSGVRVARAEWRWSGTQQRPVVQIWYVGAGELGALIKDSLIGVSAEGVPFEVQAAQPVAVDLSVGLVIDPDFLPDPVAAEVVSLLTAELLPEKVGIGAPIIRSRVLALAATVPGVISPYELYIDGAPYLAAGFKPDAGQYFEVTVTAGVA